MEIPEGRAARAGQSGRQKTGPASLIENTATKSPGKVSRPEFFFLAEVTQCFGNALKTYTWTASTLGFLTPSNDAAELRPPGKGSRETVVGIMHQEQVPFMGGGHSASGSIDDFIVP